MASEAKFFIDLSVISYSAPDDSPESVLRRMTGYFSKYLPMASKQNQDDTGRMHHHMELEDNQAFSTYTHLWTAYFEFLIRILPKYKKTINSSPPPKKSPPYIIFKLETNSPALTDLFLKQSNYAFSLIDLDIYFEEVMNGMIIFIQSPADLDYFLTDPIDDEKNRRFYKKIGISDERFFQEREQFVKNYAKALLIQK